MKKKILLTLAIITAIGVFPPAVYAANDPQAPNYKFDTTYKTDQWGNPTTSEEIPIYPENVRRDKNAAYYPPRHGVFSGEIPSDPTNPYITQDAHSSKVTKVTAPTHGVDSSSGGTNVVPHGASNVGVPVVAPVSSGVRGQSSNNGFSVRYTETNKGSQYTDARITSVTPYSDGSIGNISIPKLGTNTRVYEGVELDTMKKGIGHFAFTSQWDGNTGFASHNRGSSSFFKGIWNLENGDEIKYTTQVGTRNYKVYSKIKISETDMTPLAYTDGNIITLITCVEGDSSMRWCIQAKEVK